MNRKEFDKSLQERLNNHSSHYSDQVWKNLEAELDREKTVIGFSLFNKNILSMLFLIAGISGIAALTYYNVYHNQVKLQPTTPAPTEIRNDQKPSNPEPLVNSNPTVSLNNTKIPQLNQNHNQNIGNASYSKNSVSKVMVDKNVSSSKTNDALVVTSHLDIIEKLDNTNTVTQRDYIEITQEISPVKIMSVSKTNKNSRAIDKGLFDPKRNCPSFNTNAPGYFVEMFGSPDYSFKSYSSKDIEFESYKNARNNTESSLVGYSLGFRGGIEFRNGLSLKTGLTFSNIREEFNLTLYNVDIPDFIVVPVYDGPSGNGSHIVINDTIRFVNKGNLYINKTNSIKSFDIPLLVGYELDFTSWTLQFNTGVALQLANIQSGTVLDPQLDVTSYGDDNNYQLYKKHWGLSVYTGVQFGYKIGPAAQVYIEPNARYFPKSITLDDHPVAQKLLNLGASIGIKYRL